MDFNLRFYRLSGLLFIVSALLVMLARLQVYIHFNLEYIDTDQPYMWYGARDFSRGLFYEPRYYGQSYNTFLEALCAVPFLWLDVPVYMAVPLSTHLLSLFPFLFTACYLFFNGKPVHACTVLGLLLAMPPHYDLLNGQPRGFVTGLFLCSFFIISFIGPRKKGWALANIVLGVMGYFVNPNSMVVFAPLFVFLLTQNREKGRMLLFGATASVTFVVMFLIFDLFYRLNPDYVQNPIALRFTTSYFYDNISNLDQRFAHISPFFADRCWPLLAIIGAMVMVLWRVHRAAFMALLAGLSVVLFSFCLGKTMEGTAWVYISYSRMYLGIPLLLVLMGSFIPLPHRAIYFLLIPMLAGIYKLATLRERLEWQVNPQNFVGVRVYKLKDVLSYIDVFHGAAGDSGVPLIVVSHDFWLNNIISYGGPAVREDFPQTMETRLDKRYWVRESLGEEKIPRFLFVSTVYEMNDRLPATGWFRLKDFGYGVFLVESNTLSMRRFCALVDAYERR